MFPSRRLRENVKSESEAYGYTLSVWGSGAILLQGFDLMPVDVLSLVLGGVIGFALLTIIAFRDILGRVTPAPEKDMVTGSMIHLLASLGTVFTSYIITEFVGAFIGLTYLSMLIGINATFTYNILLLIENFVSDDIYRFERRNSE